MACTEDDYKGDLKNPEMLHIRSKEHFMGFCEFSGKEPIQRKQQLIKGRFDFIEPEGEIIELGCRVGVNLSGWRNKDLM